MQIPSISLIVPVYNTEKYLRKCLESIAVQTLQNIEVLVVNNNTQDNSQQIIDEFVAKDQRFKAIIHPEGKLGGARNAALRQAQGEFVTFVDSDDWISPIFCQTLLDIAYQHQADLIDTPGIDVDEQGHPLESVQSGPFPPSAIYHQGPVAHMNLARHHAKPWGKLLRRSLLSTHNLWFPENRPHEDIAFACACFILSSTVVLCNQPLYYYRHVPKSLSRSNLHLLPRHLFANFVPVRQLLQKEGVYSLVAPDFEYQLVHMIIGEENGGSGRLKYMSARDMRNFADEAGNFFNTLPSALFAKRKRVFRFKWQVLRFALKHRLYFLPQIMRPLYKLVDLF